MERAHGTRKRTSQFIHRITSNIKAAYQTLRSPATLPTPKMETIPIKRLPPEITLKIFASELHIQHDKGIPPLLLALAADPDKSHYLEARKIYRRTNAVVNWENEESFNKKHINKLLEIKHLKLELPLRWRAQKVTIMNNFETLIIDETTTRNTDADFSSGPMPFFCGLSECTIGFIVCASHEPMKLVLKVATPAEARLIQSINRHLDLRGSRHALPAEDAELWVWENGIVPLKWQPWRAVRPL